MDAQLMSPRIEYDNNRRRFTVIATMTDKKTFSKIFVAISKDSMPQSGDLKDWDFAAIDAWSNVGELWADELRLAVDEITIYLTAAMKHTVAMPNFEEEDRFVESRLWTLGKNPLYGGIATTAGVLLRPGELLELGSAILKSETVLDLDGTTNCTHYTPATIENDGWKTDETFGTFLVGYNTGCARGGRQELHIIRVSNPLEDSGPTLTSHFIRLIYDMDYLPSPLPDALQPDPNYTAIETGPRQVQDAAWYNETLYVALTVMNQPSNRTSVFWATIGTSSPELTLIDSAGIINGTAIGTDVSLYFPSIAVNKAEGLLISFGASGPSLYSGMYAQLQDREPILVKAGESNLEAIDGNAYSGLYSGNSVDPSEDSCYWLFNTYSRDTSDPETLNQWERGNLATSWAKVCTV
jgi:hypothetical protein